MERAIRMRCWRQAIVRILLHINVIRNDGIDGTGRARRSGFRQIRDERAAVFVRRNARGIAELQERGIADVSLDPLVSSIVLSGMVSRFAYSMFVLGEGRDDGRTIDFDEVVVTATKLWASALKFPERSSVDD